jgi:polyhydroxybutyrate depolymerase
MTRALSLLIVALAAACSSAPAATEPTLPPENPGPGDHALAIRIDGQVREFLVHAPASYSTAGTHPVVLVFHGQPGTAAEIASLSKMSQTADSKGFLAVFPDRFTKPSEVASLIDHLVAKWRADPKRIHATGFSRGAYLTYQLAHQLTNRFGSVAPVSGDGATDKPLSAPLSLLTFQGTRDRLAQGFTVNNSNWAKAAGCRDETVATVPLGDATAHRYASTCANGSEHVVYSVVGMGHEWPPEASELIWDFFAKHPLP